MKHNPTMDWRELPELLSHEDAKRKLITVAYLVGVEHPVQSYSTAIKQELFIEFRRAMDPLIQKALAAFRVSQKDRQLPKELKEQHELGYLLALEKHLQEFQFTIDVSAAFAQGQLMASKLQAIEIEEVPTTFLQMLHRQFDRFAEAVAGKRESFSEQATFLLSRISWPLDSRMRYEVAINLDATVAQG